MKKVLLGLALLSSLTFASQQTDRAYQVWERGMALDGISQKVIKKAKVTVMQADDETGRIVVFADWGEGYENQVWMFADNGELLPDNQTVAMNLGKMTAKMVEETLEETSGKNLVGKRY